MENLDLEEFVDKFVELAVKAYSNAVKERDDLALPPTMEDVVRISAYHAAQAVKLYHEEISR